MLTRAPRLALVTAATLAVVTFTPVPANARTGGSPPSVPQRAGLCVFEAKGDYVEVSTAAREAAGHAWWVNVNCDATTAIVTVQLQQQIDGQWRDAGPQGRAVLRSGGGNGHRATGQATCTTDALTAWRSVIDVDVLNVLDPPNKLTTVDRKLHCRH